MPPRRRHRRPPPAMDGAPSDAQSDYRRSCPRTEYGVDPRFDMKALARVRGRARGWSKKRRAREMRRLLDQPNQRGRVACNPDHLQLVTLDAELCHVGMVGQELRERLDDDHAGRCLVLAALEDAQLGWRARSGTLHRSAVA